MPIYYGFDTYYLIFVVPALLIALFAQIKVKSTYHKYSALRNARSLTGAEAAQRILSMNGIHDVSVQRVSGEMTDHYDPRAGVIRLSDGVYNSTSIAAVGIAAHEAGHAVQHAEGYVPIKVRNAVLPVANLGSAAAIPLVLFGLIFNFSFLITLGIVFFSAVVLFQLVTLPVEFNASSRAIRVIDSQELLTQDEIKGAKKVLTAAAMTYVASALVALMQLLRLLAISRNRND